MTRKVKIGLILGVSILMLLIFVLITQGGKTANANTTTNNGAPKKTYSNWNERYDLSSNEPFGLVHWNNSMKLHLNANQSINTIDYLYSIDTIPKTSKPTFMFVGDHFVAHEEEIDSLLTRVRNGANLFIAGYQIDGVILKKLFRELEMGFYYDTIITLATSNKSFTFVSQYEDFTVATDWNGYKNFQTSDSIKHQVISGFGNLVNNIKLKLGKGSVYLNSIPQLYTNHGLLSKDGYDYANLWLKEIPKDQSVYWLELARFTHWEEDYYDEDETQAYDSSYLQFIFQEKNRVISVLLIAIGVLLFVIFRAKRLQPLVPIMGKKRNMTLIFADTITSIYFNHRDPFTMVQIQKANFISIIHKHFHIDFSKEFSEKAIISLSQKSNVSKQEIESILEQFNQLKKHTTTEQDLANLRSSVLNFYRNSGLISTRILERLEEKEYHSYRNEWISGLFIIFGIILLMYGMFLLTKATAIGIVFWPLGALPIIIGVVRLLKPFYSWSNKELIYTPLVGKKKHFLLNDLKAINQNDHQIQLQFEQQTVQINFWELNQSDAKQFKRFAMNHNKLK